MSAQGIRRDLVAHVREQIQADAEAYANDAKLRAISDRLLKAVLDSGGGACCGEDD